MGINKQKQAVRSCSQPEQQYDEPASKQRKVWQHGDVTAHCDPPVEPDYTYNRQWTAVCNAGKVENIAYQLEKDVGSMFKLDHCLIHMHNSFTEAVRSVLEDIKAAESSVIVVHGVPSIGKSTLAKILAYYLAMSTEEGRATYRELKHQKNIGLNKDDVTASIMRLIFDKKYVVIDQCNLNYIHAHDILYSGIEHFDEYRTPIILFTSGHYALPKEWTSMSQDEVKFKVIDMKVDAKTITNIMTTELMIEESDIPEDLESNVLAVTTNIGRIRKLLTRIDKTDIDSVVEDVYSSDDIHTLSRNVAYGVWLTWEREMRKNGVKAETSARLSVEYVMALVKTQTDSDRNGIINILDIVGKKPEVSNDGSQVQIAGASAETAQVASNKEGNYVRKMDRENKGYFEYKIDEYEYILLYPQYVRRVLRSCSANTTPKIKIIRQAYDYFTYLSFSQHQFVRGGLFEHLVEVYCSHPYGLCASSASRYCDRKRVERHAHVSTINDLCQLPSSVMDSDFIHKTFTFWVVLNCDKAPQFQGFDFAYFSLEKSESSEVEVRELQLFNATVKPENKDSATKSKMVKCLDNIREGLKREGYIKESNYEQVVPYYLCPVGVHETITLPNKEKATVCWVDTTVIGLASESS